MKKSRRRALVAILVVFALILGMAGYLVASTLGSGEFVTELPFEKPESLVFHERLAEYIAQDAGASSDTVDPELERAAKSLERWQAVIDLAGVRLENTDAGQGIDDLVAREPAEWAIADRQRLETLISENNDLIEKTREAVRFGAPIQLAPSSLDMLFKPSNASALAKLLRLICLRVPFHAAQGDQTAAVDDALLGMKIADLLAAQPSMVSHLRCWVLSSRVASALQRAFPPGKLDSREVDRLVAQAPWAYHRDAFADSLRVDAILESAQLAQHADQAARSELPLQASYTRWSVQRNQADYIRAVALLLEVANKPYHEAASTLEEVKASSPGMVEDIVFSLDGVYAYTKDTRKSLSKLFAMHAGREVTIDLLRIGLLIEQHYAEDGSYPDSLEVLAPAFGGNVPPDPFSGEPYRYVVNDDGFLLYSVDRNQVDDGGVHDHVNGDLVWRGERE